MDETIVISSDSGSDSPETTPLPRQRKPVHSCHLCRHLSFDLEWEQILRGGCPKKKAERKKEKAERRKRERERRAKNGIETIVISDSKSN